MPALQMGTQQHLLLHCSALKVALPPVSPPPSPAEEAENEREGELSRRHSAAALVVGGW